MDHQSYHGTPSRPSSILVPSVLECAHAQWEDNLHSFTCWMESHWMQLDHFIQPYTALDTLLSPIINSCYYCRITTVSIHSMSLCIPSPTINSWHFLSPFIFYNYQIQMLSGLHFVIFFLHSPWLTVCMRVCAYFVLCYVLCCALHTYFCICMFLWGARLQAMPFVYPHLWQN